MKTSGTGNTGWVVVFGDTGWRDITGSLPVAPSSGRLLINRTGDLVTYKAAALMYSANQYIEMTEPPGFVGALFAGGWAGNIGRLLSSDGVDAGYGKFSRFSPSTPRIFWTFRAGVAAASELSIHTINPWPTTMPGIPA